MTMLGAIIAGGQARRFGADKGATLLGDRPLIEHVARALAPQVDDLIVVGREWRDLVTVMDRPRAGEGPLGGLCAALHHAHSAGYDAALCAGCDTLPIPTDLCARLTPGPSVVEEHWLMGLWPSALADDLDRWLSVQADRSIRGWMRQCGARAVPFDVPLTNINTPADLQKAERLIGRTGQS